MTQGGEIVTGLDIGTTKICVIIAELTEGGIEIIGCGTSPSRGLKKGVVVNIDVTVESIKKAVEAAEAMAGISLNSAFVGIAGSHIKGINSRGVIAVSGKNYLSAIGVVCGSVFVASYNFVSQFASARAYALFSCLFSSSRLSSTISRSRIASS